MERSEVKPRRREEGDEATHQRRGGEGEGGALLRRALVAAVFTRRTSTRLSSFGFFTTLKRTEKGRLNVHCRCAMRGNRRRLTFLCELLVLLEDEVAHTTDTTSADLRSTRGAALAVANNARKDLARRLRALAGGQQKLLGEVAQVAPPARPLPLSVTLNAAANEGDAPSVNRTEGRVLREMRLAQRLFNESREAGVNVPALIAGPSLKAIFGKADAVGAPAPTPPPAG